MENTIAAYAYIVMYNYNYSLYILNARVSEITVETIVEPEITWVDKL